MPAGWCGAWLLGDEKRQTGEEQAAAGNSGSASSCADASDLRGRGVAGLLRLPGRLGIALTLPYTIDRQTYAIAPYYVWQQHGRSLSTGTRFCTIFIRSRSSRCIPGFTRSPVICRGRLSKAYSTVLFFAGLSLLPPLFMARRVFLDRRIRFLVVCLLVVAGGMAIEIYLIPYYVAPFTAAIYAVGLQMMRHLRVWKTGRSPVGLAMVRLTDRGLRGDGRRSGDR